MNLNIREQVLLKDYTTFKIGGPADYFIEVSSIDEAQAAVVFAKSKKLPILVIGGGSNLLVADSGFRGVVIKLKLEKLEFNGQQVTVGAGVLLSYLLNQALEHNLTGLEFCAGIPGTVGGAVRGNAGTYGLSMANVVREITYFDANYELKTLPGTKAGFAYRHSIFKEIPSMILELSLKLNTGDVAAARQLIQERLQYRQDTQPNEPSAGCIFKNVEFSRLDLNKLKDLGIDIDKFSRHQKIPAAYLIEKAGLKGHKIGQAQISAKHANYIINTGEAKAEQVIMLISFIKQQIRDKYGIQLHEEVQLVL